jgi:hypothetical protein
MPSSSRFLMAPAGQTLAQAGFSQCMQDIETNVRLTSGNVPLHTSATLRMLMVPARVPFHALQATWHDQHLMHRLGSIQNPYWLFMVCSFYALLILTSVCFAI